jgi:DNA mismatch endonuclease (patch repair protein)
MRAVRSIGTKPEATVANWLKQARFKPLFNCRELPGKPDLVLPRRKVAVFVNGCFWHGHKCKRGSRIPATNTAYWTAKISKNRNRDSAAIRALRASGWTALTVWECQSKSERQRLKFLKAIKAIGMA